ncbi:MAG: hypothetical protein BGO90_11545 [Legionella sp. 40-6]|nr:MAG: hypothetical protein BGO90_11545 [Legionella sp. 40-6]
MLEWRNSSKLIDWELGAWLGIPRDARDDGGFQEYGALGMTGLREHRDDGNKVFQPPYVIPNGVRDHLQDTP